MAGRDQEQDDTIHAPVTVRQVVTAGPGCGKTHVACARVAHLLASGVAPDQLLLISFTRTAVHELRERIATLAGSSVRASGVEIRTLDSLSWRIVRAGTELVPAQYGAVVDAAFRALTSPSAELRQYMHRFRHVFIDESQDLVGPRARLAFALLHNLSSHAGYTVFIDPAQAIYGWSSEDGDVTNDVQFVDLIENLPGSVERRELKTMHRSDDAAIKDLLTRARSVVLGDGDALQGLRETTRPLSAEPVREWQRFAGVCTAQADETLVLFRRRVEALLASSNLSQQGILHRLRVGALPRLTAPWISVVANRLAQNHYNLRPSRTEFARIWQRVEHLPLARGWTVDSAWSLLQRIVPGERIDLARVADLLAWGSAPDDVFKKDPGDGRIIVGTIHSSKGREASRVVLCSALDGHAPADASRRQEEARVLYVGMSRARHAMELRAAPGFICQYDDGRAWHRSANAVHIEIGRDGDVDALWPMYMDGDSGASTLQETLEQFPGHPVKAKMVADRTRNWSRLIRTDSDDRLIGSFTRQARSHLSRLGGGDKATNFMAHLWWFDVTTYAIRDDDSRLENVPYPWNETRMWLAPIVIGVGLIPGGRNGRA